MPVGLPPIRNAFRKDAARHLLPATVNWTLFAYAFVLCLGIWGLALQRIQSDYASTLLSEREHLRSVSGTLEAQVEAMLADGVGAALAAVNELEYRTDGGAGGTQSSDTLSHMLTGGPYVRSLFLANSQRFVRVGRTSAPDTEAVLPVWLQPISRRKSDDAWVGAPMPDPENPAERVVPVARRVSHGRLRDTWAGALIAFSRLQGVYQQPESSSGVGLLAEDGTILLLILPDAKLRTAEGSNIANSELFDRGIHGPDSGVLEGTSPLAGRPTIVAYNRVTGYPMLAIASRRRAESLAAWYGRRINTVALAAGITLLVILTTWMLNRSVRALRRRELHYRTLFNNAAFGAFVLEGEQIIEANRTSAAMFGVDHPSVLIGRRLWDLSPATQPDGTSSEELCRDRMHLTIHSSAASFEWIHQRLDTVTPFHTAVDLSSLDAGGKTLTLAVIHDVSERKLIDAERERALDELHELAATLVRIQDEERRRIGRDLHDSTGQSLVSLELSLTRLVRVVGPPLNSLRSLADECVTLARQCSTEIRTAAYLLHPPLLDEIGLLSALRWLADGLRQRSGIKIELELPDSLERLPPEHELAIFRVAQEALTNVHRHSKSPSVIVRLFEREGAVIMEVEDAGHGILVAGSSGKVTDAAALGVGLAGMRERMRQLGGSLSVRTGPQGTCVQAKLPVTRTAATA
jgi:PAS domain S-box-containing protein